MKNLKIAKIQQKLKDKEIDSLIINRTDEFLNEYFEKYNQYPNQLSFLSYDLVGLVYYLILQNNSVVDKKMFKKKNLFKGKVGIFEIKNNKINHILNFYKAEDGEFKKVF